jgi:lipid-A-disaccharide synthase
MKAFKIFVIVGEPSGDKLAGNLLECLLRQLPLQIYGTGGKHLKALGQKHYYSIESLEIIGIDGLLRKSIDIIKIFRDLKNKLLKLKPNIVLLIDYPGFNIKFARFAKKQGFTVIYYVAPQIWAWHYRRIYTLKNNIDLLLCILPFEVDMFSKVGIKAIYSGNPILSQINYTFNSKGDFFKSISLNPTNYTVAILPGSRKNEIVHHLPILARTMDSLKDIQFIICKSSEISSDLMKKYIKENKYVKIIEGNSHDCLKYADFAWICSGTACLEAAIINIPMLIFYRPSLLTYLLAKIFLKIPYIGLPNIILGKKIIPELIGSQMREKKIVKTFSAEKEDISKQIKYLMEVNRKLAINYDPVKYAANIIKDYLKY